MKRHYANNSPKPRANPWTHTYSHIGSWWETSKGKNKEQHEIDIVAIHAREKKVLVAEVKRQRKNFKPELFQEKVEAIRTKLFFNHELETAHSKKPVFMG